MRRAISNISSRHGQPIAIEICTSLRYLQSSFQKIYIPNAKSMTRGFSGDLATKIEVMKNSVTKVENAVYNMHVRGSEKPDGWSVEQEGRKHQRFEDDDDDDDIGRGKRRRIEQD